MRVHIRDFRRQRTISAAALAELGLPIKNPAVYLTDKNLILAGSDLNRFDAELAQVNRAASPDQAAVRHAGGRDARAASSDWARI